MPPSVHGTINTIHYLLLGSTDSKLRGSPTLLKYAISILASTEVPHYGLNNHSQLLPALKYWKDDAAESRKEAEGYVDCYPDSETRLGPDLGDHHECRPSKLATVRGSDSEIKAWLTQ